METSSSSMVERSEEVRSFIRRAYAKGLISLEAKRRLEDFADDRYGVTPAAAPEAPATQAPVAAAPPTSLPEKPAPPMPKPTPTSHPVRTSSPAAATRAATRVTDRVPVSPPPPAPPPSPPPGPSWSERLEERLRVAWSRLTADFAANSLIYLGVLLAVVVIFVFFAFGYFGEAVGVASLRSMIFVAAPLVFFGLAWVLRNRVGLPAAANAVGLIGAAILPIMLSALFQDGSDWGSKAGAGAWFPLSWIPDLSGPDRWYGYAIVGLVSAAIYYLLARRHRIYAYGVAPMLWAVVGALGLFWAKDMSGPQMLTVLAAIGIGLVIASLGRGTSLGKQLSVPTVRIGVVGAPFVFGFALLFAYDDAIQAGATTPGLSDLAYPGAAAAALLALVLAISSGTAFAWSALGERTREALAVVLRVAAYGAAGVAVVLALSYQTSTGWVGAAMVVYGLLVAAIDRVVGGTGTAAMWIARGAVLIGAAMTLVDPVATTVVWGVLGLMAAGRALYPTARSMSSPLVPAPATDEWASAELWLPASVAVIGGLARIVDPLMVPTVLMGAALVSVSLQFLPKRFEPLRSFAGIPAIGFAIAAAGFGAWLQADEGIFTLLEIGVGLAVLSVVAAAVTYPWAWRLPAVIVLANGSALAIAAHATDRALGELTFAMTASLTATGVALVIAAFVPRLSRWSSLHAAYGHGALVASVVAPIRADIDLDALLLSLSVVLVVSLIEAVLAPRRLVPFIEATITEPAGEPSLRELPAAVALVALVPWSLLAANELAWFSAESTRLAIVLGGVGAIYAATALLHRAPSITALAAFLGYGTVAASVAVSIGDGHAALVVLVIGSITTLGIAVALRTALLSAISWALAFSAIVVGTVLAGVPIEEAHRLVGVWALGTAAAATALALWNRLGSMKPWLATTAGVASIVMAASMALALPSADVLWPWAILAATVTLATAIAFRWALVVPIAWLYLLVAYVDAFDTAIQSDPVWLVPFGAAGVLVSAVLPGRRSWRLTDPSVLSLGSGLVVLAATVAMAAIDGGSGASLAWTALVLAAVAFVRAEDAWLHAGVAALITAGAWEGDVWLASGLAVGALIETAIAERRRDRWDAAPLRWVAMVLWGATYAATIDWLDLAPLGVTWLTLSLGSVFSTGAALVMIDRPRMTSAVVRRWWQPAGALGQALMFVAGAYGSAELSVDEAFLAWAVVAGIEAALVGTVATLRSHQAGVWMSAALAGTSSVLFTAALDAPPNGVIFGAMTVGAALSGLALMWWLTDARRRLSLWILPIGALGQAALVASMLRALELLSEPNATLVWAAIVWIEAVLLGVAGTVKRLEAVVWTSTLFIGVGAALGLRGLNLDSLEVVWTTSILAVGLLTVWLVSTVGTESDRIRIWQLPMAALAQVSILTAGISATSSLGYEDGAMTWFVLGLMDAVAIGLVATVSRTGWMAYAAAALVPPVIAAGVTATGLETPRVWIWTTAFIAAAVGATFATRVRDQAVAGLWHIPLQVLAGVLAAATLVSAWDLFTDRQLLLLGAALSAAIGVHLLANRQWLSTFEIEGEPIAALLLVVSGGLVAASLRPDDAWWIWAVLGLTLIGVVAAGVAGRHPGLLRVSWLIVGVGYSLIGLVTAGALAGVPSVEVGWVLMVMGSAFAAFAVTSGQPVVWHGAVLTWLAAGLILVEEEFGLELHMTALAISVVLLVMLEVERLRMRRQGADAPDWMRVAEWVVMLVPLALAARDMVVVATAYGLLLGAEGLALLVWGVLTQTRRRALVGLGAVTAAILLAVMIPLIEGFDTSLSVGVWLIIGGITAVVFITAGSVIEKYRTRIGEQLHHFGEIIERWN